jgi:hypothetical protein
MKVLEEEQGGSFGARSALGKGSVFFPVLQRSYKEIRQPNS